MAERRLAEHSFQIGDDSIGPFYRRLKRGPKPSYSACENSLLQQQWKLERRLAGQKE